MLDLDSYIERCSDTCVVLFLERGCEDRLTIKPLRVTSI